MTTTTHHRLLLLCLLCYILSLPLLCSALSPKDKIYGDVRKELLEAKNFICKLCWKNCPPPQYVLSGDDFDIAGGDEVARDFEQAVHNAIGSGTETLLGVEGTKPEGPITRLLRGFW